MAFNRRQFLWAASAGAAGLALPRAGFAQPTRPLAKFKLGLGTYTFRALDLDHLIGRCKEMDLNSIELSHPQYMLPQAKLDEFRSVSGQLKSGGLDVMSWFCGHLTDSSGIEAMVEGSRSLGVKTVSGSAERPLLDEINTACAKAGLGFGIHNHYFRDRKFLYESPEDVLSAIKGHPHVFSTLDTGHMIALGIDPTDAYRKMKGHVRIIHVKDEDVPGHSVVLGKGKGNIARFIRSVAHDSFPGLVAIEYEEGDDPKEEVSECAEYVRGQVRFES
jgi:sugar phosphate isomerase/epimerase